ncbi:MAG: glutamate-5-semialdehyde dehydrogenase, partial [Rhodospirillaceae bacterium]
MSQLQDVNTIMRDLGRRARNAAAQLANAPRTAKDKALRDAAAFIREDAAALIEANAQDMEVGRSKNLTEALLDRLLLTEDRIEAMAKGLEDIAELPDPVGHVLSAWDRPNGLQIERVAVPLGVIGVIYESRPNVTADAAALCLKAGNAVILRGGSESFHSSRAIHARIAKALVGAGLPEDAVSMVPTTDRAAVGALLTLSDYVDVIVPRGGRGLIERITAESRIPLFKHLDGINHTYLHAGADAEKAVAVTVNGKMRRTSICGATETVLVDKAVASDLLPPLAAALKEKNCLLRGDETAQALVPDMAAATPED